MGHFRTKMRVLFITATRIGDAVLSTGLINHIHKKYPEAQITVACGPAAAEIFETMPNLERLIVLDKMLFSLHWLRFWFLCAPYFWSLIIDLRNSPLSYLLFSRKQKHLGRSNADKHRVLTLAEVLGLQQTPPSPILWPSKQHRVRAEKIIPSAGFTLALGPAANWAAKTWDPEKFITLVRRLSSKDGLMPNCRIAVFGRDDERPKILRIIQSIPEGKRLDLVGKLKLVEIYACMERCNLYIGNDSGLMHMAAASGIPTLGLFGPSKEELYAPWGENCASIRTIESFDEIHPDQFDHRKSGSLMDGLSVEAVEKKASELLRKKNGSCA